MLPANNITGYTIFVCSWISSSQKL